jgi:hypothetical protein
VKKKMNELVKEGIALEGGILVPLPKHSFIYMTITWLQSTEVQL